MAIWSEVRNIVRWLLRRSDPPPPPGTGQRHQAAEQAAARQRLLDQAQRARDTRWYCEPTQIVPTVRMTLGQLTCYGTRTER
ncbi:hypothetical protein ACFY2R_08370 [Micromonospora olivasterospora]|uniref:Uncharacterized protein n=1 Tax=Micromonospora olivasterospora TaxID=1880 RepID=A0A562I8E4_MICOL|nr:hypothetical protein [Micromonospora olivasterospora]TWH67058.1 hypothetical protein JD77_02022 [Micromonospora olivasterospora]